MSGVEEEPGPIWHGSSLGKSLVLNSTDSGQKDSV